MNAPDFRRRSMSTRTAARCAPAVLGALLLSSCSQMVQTYEDNPKAVLGSVIGIAAGAGIAAAAGGGAGAIVGAGLGGGLIGGLVGNRLDARDKRMAAEAAQRAFDQNRTGQASAWQNPDSGNSGSITPTRTYQIANGQYCREYQQTIMIGGEPQRSYGTACRQPDGSWQIQNT
jgi:surface antigen